MKYTSTSILLIGLCILKEANLVQDGRKGETIGDWLLHNQLERHNCLQAADQHSETGQVISSL